MQRQSEFAYCMQNCSRERFEYVQNQMSQDLRCMQKSTIELLSMCKNKGKKRWCMQNQKINFI